MDSINYNNYVLGLLEQGLKFLREELNPYEDADKDKIAIITAYKDYFNSVLDDYIKVLEHKKNPQVFLK